MEVKVKLYTILKKYGEGKIGDDDTLTIQDNITLADLTSSLEIPEKVGKVFLVNGYPKQWEHVLHEGDEVKIFSFVGGG